jgi:hypothetical protein
VQNMEFCCHRRSKSVLTDSPVVRSAGARILFLVGAIVTVTILEWTHQLFAHGDLHGLTVVFFVLFVHEDYGASICALVILIVAIFAPSGSPGRNMFLWAGNHPFAVATFGLVMLLSGALGVYHKHPLSMDEYAAYFQSQVFAAGHLSGQFPAPLMDWLIPQPFQNFFLNVSQATGKIASSYWPAHAMIMAPFTLVGMSWACNPVLSALTLLVIHRLALYTFEDTEAAGLALLLTVASPVFFGIGISYYSMPAHLLANSLYALLLVRPTPAKVFVAGIVGSIALSLHNPIPHMLFAAPWFIWIGTRRGGIRLLAALCAGYLPLCILLGVGWFEFSTHLQAAGPAPTAANGDSANRLKNMLAVFSLPNATVVLSRSIGLAKVWVWGVPGLLVLACYGAVRGRGDTICRLLAASALATLIGYFFFAQDQGHGWGYRYFHAAWMSLPLLATAAIYTPAGLDARRDHISVFADSATKSYIAACVLLTLVFGVGFRAWQMQEFIADDLNQLPRYQGTGRRIVLIDTSRSFYGADLVQNDPWMRGEEIRMISHGPSEDAKMMAQYYPAWRRVSADRFGTVWSAKD